MKANSVLNESEKIKCVKSFAVILAMACLSLALIFSWGDYKQRFKVIANDIFCYYNYLPAVFKYHSLDFSHTPMRIGYVKDENGIVSQKMTMGLAFLYLPFYLLAWLFNVISGLPNDEYGTPYQLMLCLSSVFYMLAGMFILRKILLLYFSDCITTLALITIFAGTNLLHYTVFEGPMPHAYNFFLVALFLRLVIKWHEKPKWGTNIALGLVTGLIVLIRPSNVTILLLFILWNVHSKFLFIDKLRLIRKIFPKMIVACILAMMVWLPQMAYWKYATGHWLYFSYVGERFFFDQPHIILGMFSYRNGWLMYAPVMIFSLVGMIVLRKEFKQFFVPIFVYFIISIYVIFCWWCWWYVGFGLRAMIDLYPILAIPLCAVLSRITSLKKFLRITILTLWALLIVLGTFKNYQYKKSIIHFDGMTGKAYWKSFFSTEIPERYFELLKSPDYEAAKMHNNQATR